MAPVKSDPLFLKAEQLAGDISLFPRAAGQRARLGLEGVLEPARIRQKVRQLQALDVDDYISQTVLPVEDTKRPGARAVLRRLPWPVVREVQVGPLYALEMRVPIGGKERRVGFIAQERTVNNGVWMPEHHLKAVEIVRDLSTQLVPIVTLIDTPGADAGDQANRGNQAHSISRLIAEMAQIHVPTVGVILGNGYSGGAIPLATTNLLLSVRDGVFNTIQPRGLANIARKYDLSWQECAKFVGVSPFELYRQGYLDGIIDFVPGEEQERLKNLELAIVSALEAIETDAMNFVKVHVDDVFEHYRGSIFRFLEPSATLKELQELGNLSLLQHPTVQLNVFGVAFRYLRYLGLRRRIRSTTVERYGRLSVDEIPRGERSERMERERRNAFEKWLESPIEIKYDDFLSRAWKRYSEARRSLDQDRGRVAAFFLGSRQANYEKAKEQLVLEAGCYLYNLWKDAAQYNFRSLIDFLIDLERRPRASAEDVDVTILDVVADPDVRPALILEVQSFTVFDLLYDNVIGDLKSIAREASDHNFISRESVERLLGSAMRSATRELVSRGEEETSRQDELRLRRQFLVWLRGLASFKRRGTFLKSVAQWKKLAFPRVSEPLFAIVTFIFERLLPSYYHSEEGDRVYDGRINLRDIGVKDFWNRLDRAYRDLLISDILARVKRDTQITPETIFDRFFSDVREVDGNLMTADPVLFPGFRVSIEEALRRGIKPCGTVTALASLKGDARRQVGVMVSNLAFQAGSFDMASAEKFCRLLVECARRRLPVLCFVSSGGMQTKEGAGSLFSMAIANDRITRFVRDHDLPVVCFGFGDCTGGAQASLVTHPLALTYYFSGTNMPFAGQIVVPSHLPLTSTLSNYLSTVPGAMEGLLRHPFADGLDEEMREVDARIPVAEESVEEVLARVLAGRLRRESDELPEGEAPAPSTYRPIRRALVHARGCTAVKLLRATRKLGIEAVLVQSDPDMESVAASMLGEQDSLICLGGSTPDESYLNAHSVVRIAEREGVDSLHPGIGFLSESAAFADLCRRHGLNFIGPSVSSMELMGNKSNAIQTAQKLDVPVVPGSHGIVTEVEAARLVAEGIGYPVIIKAVHGGGGKGIRVVRRAEDFRAAFQHIMAEARSAFGNGDCYIEKFIVSLRHVEVQVLRDRFGNTRVLGLRDCSVQRSNQKLIEESGSTALPERLREAAFRYASAIADEIDYVGVGTVEFIYDLEADAIYFMEMNTRLQVEHPVTELTTRVDIVKAQFDIASGASVAELSFDQQGYALEVRVNAEKVVREVGGGVAFVPDPGTVTRCHFPARDDVHVISAVAEGSVVPPYYDSLVAQIICWGRDRAAAIDHLQSYLAEVRLEGIATNIRLYRRILADETFRNGEYDTNYLQEFLPRTDVRSLIAEVEEAAGKARGRVDRATIAIEGSDELKVVAPSPGIFYLTPSPNEPELTRVGDLVSSEQTLCLLEAMKLFQPLSLASFNEEGELYPSDCHYEIVRVNPSNAQAVNQGDLLFVVRPARRVA